MSRLAALPDLCAACRQVLELRQRLQVAQRRNPEADLALATMPGMRRALEAHRETLRGRDALLDEWIDQANETQADLRDRTRAALKSERT